jgi:hypothetical protein
MAPLRCVALRQRGDFPESMTNAVPVSDSAVEDEIYLLSIVWDERVVG